MGLILLLFSQDQVLPQVFTIRLRSKYITITLKMGSADWILRAGTMGVSPETTLTLKLRSWSLLRATIPLQVLQ